MTCFVSHQENIATNTIMISSDSCNLINKYKDEKKSCHDNQQEQHEEQQQQQQNVHDEKDCDSYNRPGNSNNHKMNQMQILQQLQQHESRKINHQELLLLYKSINNIQSTTTVSKVTKQREHRSLSLLSNNKIKINNSINLFSLVFVLCVLIQIVLLLPIVVHASFTIKIDEPGVPHCFSIRIPMDQDYELRYGTNFLFVISSLSFSRSIGVYFLFFVVIVLLQNITFLFLMRKFNRNPTL
jgi:hypothetical protein